MERDKGDQTAPVRTLIIGLRPYTRIEPAQNGFQQHYSNSPFSPPGPNAAMKLRVAFGPTTLQRSFADRRDPRERPRKELAKNEP